MSKYTGVVVSDPSPEKIVMGGMFYELSQDAVTARAGGGQVLATQLTGQTARITVVATAGDSVMLPPSAAGLEILVINHGANSMQVYGAGTDLINDAATAVGVSQMANSSVIFMCATTGNWYTDGLGTGFSGGFQTQSYANGITAFAGGGQGSAVLLSAMINRVTVVATIGDSVKLPIAVPGMQIMVTNAAANSMNLFPGVGDAINALGANAAYAVAGGKTVSLICAVALQWHAILSA